MLVFPRTRAEPCVHDTTHFAREHGRHTGIGIDDHHRSGSSGRHPCQDGVAGIVDDGGSTDRRADLEFAATGPGGRAAVADRARVGRGTGARTKQNAARIDALPFDGISIAAVSDPCSTRPVTLTAARADLAVMPKLAHVTHNFVRCRFFDNAAPGSTVGPYEMSNDQTWATIANNLAAYAQAAREVGGFDGIMVDTEYYGTGPNPWDYDTIPIPWTYGASRPWTLPAPAKAFAQARGKQITDAIKRAWPTAVLFHFRGAELSDPASFTAERMMGNQVAWANELAGPFFIGAVESAAGRSLTLVDAGESYRQRTPQQFANAYRWLKTGLADSNGPIIPSGAVTPAVYKATVTVASHLFDRDMNHSYANFAASDVAGLLSMAMNPTVTDKYCWIYTEQHDWRGSGWPQNAVPAPFTTAIASARTARSAA